MRPLPTLAFHPLRLAFLTGLWAVSAIAFLTRLDRFSTLMSCSVSLGLGLGLGAVLLMGAAPLAEGPRRGHQRPSYVRQ